MKVVKHYNKTMDILNPARNRSIKSARINYWLSEILMHYKQ